MTRRVESLTYEIMHDNTVDFTHAKPRNVEKDGFRVELRGRHVYVKFTDDFSTIEEAKEAARCWVCTWEFFARLDHGPSVELVLRGAATDTDRRPVGTVHVLDELGMKASAWTTERVDEYPQPKIDRVSPNALKMHARLMSHLQGNESLPAMAYFCLTVVKENGGLNRSAERYSVSERVLRTVGRLSTEKGGRQARKAMGTETPLSRAEKAFLCQAVKTLIRRVNEVDNDPEGDYKKITMNDLPRPK